MTDLLIIAPLPPCTSDAALMAGALVRYACSRSLDVTVVIDDLAPPPAPDQQCQATVIRRRDLVEQQGVYKTTPRLYVIGSAGDSLFALELFRQSAGAVMIANNSLFSLAQPLLEANGEWPGAYWQWLVETVGEDHAAILFSAAVCHRREAEAQANVTPSFDLLLGKDAKVIAPSPYVARQLSACGISPCLTLPLALDAVTSKGSADVSSGSTTATTENTSLTAQAINVLIVSDTEEISDHLSVTLGLYPATQMANVASITRARPDTAARIEHADIIILADGQNISACPLLALAFAAGKAVVTTGQRFAAHLPEGTHLSVPHADASDSLAIAVAALISQPALKEAISASGKQFAAESGDAITGRGLTTLAAQASGTALSLQRPERPAPQPVSAPAVIRREPVTDVQIALIGAPPPNKVISQLLPSLDPALCPRFATPPVANRLARIGRHDAASMLARTGFEAPLVMPASPQGKAHRDAVKWADLAQGLRFGSKAMSFACEIEGVPSAGGLASPTKMPAQLPLRIDYDGKTSAPTSGYDTENGFFWDYDIIRHRLKYILLVGGETELALINSSKEHAFMIADSANSSLLLPGKRGYVCSDSLGILEIAVAGYDRVSGATKPTEDLRRSLADQGLILEWPSHD